MVSRRACLLASQAMIDSDVSDDEGETLRAIGDGRKALEVLRNDERLKTITRRFNKEADVQVHRAESDRLKRPVQKKWAWQVIRDRFLDAAGQVVGFPKPITERDSDHCFAGYCNWLLDGKPQPDQDLMRAADILDTADFREELLKRLWGECPEEAEEMQLPPIEEPAPGVGQGGKAATHEPDDAWLGHAEIARRVGVDPENLRKRLDRFRRTNHDCYREVAEGERKPSEPKYLYRTSLVKPVIDALKTPNGTSA